ISAGSIIIGTGTFAATGSITIGGTLAFTGAGTLKVGGNFTNNGTFTPVTSTVLFDASVTQNQNQTIGGSSTTSFYNITANNIGTTNDTIFLNNSISVSNNMTISTGVFSCLTNSITGPGSSGTFTMNALTSFLLGLTTNTTNVAFPSFKTNTVNSTSTVIYQSDGTQTISALTYGNLTLLAGTHNPQKVSSSSALTIVSGNLIVGNGTSSGVVLNGAANYIGIVGNVTIGTDGTISYSGAGTLNIEGNFVNNNATSGFACGLSIVEFAGTAVQNHNQTLSSASAITFYGFKANNLGTTNNTVLLNHAITVSNALSILSGQLACQTNTITGPGSASGTCTISAGATFLLGLTSSTTVIPFPVFKTNTLNAGSTVIFQADGVQTIPTGITYGNLDIYAGSHTPTNVPSSAASFTVAGSLIVGNGVSTGVKFQLSTNILTVGVNVTIGTDGTLAYTGAGNLKVAGNFTNNNVFTPATSTITFDGTTSQTMGGNSTIFNNLALNNAAGLVAGTSETINNILTLTNGQLTLGANTLTLGSTATISGASANSYVVTNGTGTLSKVYNGTGTFNFPVGDNTAATDYSPLSLNITSGSTFPATINVVTVKNKEANNNSSSDYLNRYWTVTSGLTTLSCTFQGTYLTGDVAGAESGITTGLWTGSTPWIKYNAVNTTSHYVSGILTKFGDITGISSAGPTVTITPTTVCSSSPIITATPVGDPTFTYLWNTGATTSTLNIATPGSYTVTVTDGNGFTATKSATIAINTPAISLSSIVGTNAQTICNNSPITNITYTVDPGTTGTTVTGLPSGVTSSFLGNTCTISGTPVVSGNYSYTVTTVGPCSPQASLSGTITVDSLPTVTLSSTAGTDGQTVCTNSAITDITYTISGTATGASLTGTLPPGVNGSFNAGVFTIKGTPTISGISGGNYSYTVTTTGGSCSPQVSASGTITVDSLPTISLSSGLGTDGQTVCNNSAITDITYAISGTPTGASLTGSLPAGVTGSFNAGVFTIMGTPTISGNYSYTVTTTGGSCSPQVNLSGTIIVNPLPSVSITGNILSGFTICSGNNDTLTAIATGGSGSGYIFTWSDGGSTATDIETTAATYSVTVIDGNGCSDTASQAVSVNATPTVTVTPNAPGLCTGGTVNMNANGATNYTWSPATGLNVTTGSSVNSNPSATQTYTITGTTGSCSAIATATVTVASSLTVTVTPSAPAICLGNNVTLNGNGASSFTWKSSTGLSCTSCPSPIASPVSTTTYTVVGTSGSCVDSANVVVTVNQLPTVSVTGNITGGFAICTGNVDTLKASSTGGSGSGYLYDWNSGTTTSTETENTAGTYSVTVTDGNGCTNTTSATVVVNSLPTVNISADVIGGGIICQMSDTLTANSTGNGGFAYKWNNGSTSSTLVASAAGTYTVTVTDANGCTNSATQTLSANTKAITVTGLDSIAGIGVVDTLTAHNGTSYNWSTGSNSSTVMVTPSALTVYTVTGIDSNGCHDTVNFTVKVGPNGIANITAMEGTSLYPNPAVNTINLSFEMQGVAKAAVIKVIDLSGREVISTTAIISNGKVMPLNISELTSGTYFVKVITEKTTQVGKFVKQ
ncbi:MAG TPA: T9SS type A sorting domain-containing protein, partial [Bacteroidia bacterium]|nr:T9SS type A sorting domain-containing protein [Bacteroidia bacterium]